MFHADKVNFKVKTKNQFKIIQVLIFNLQKKNHRKKTKSKILKSNVKAKKMELKILRVNKKMIYFQTNKMQEVLF